MLSIPLKNHWGNLTPAAQMQWEVHQEGFNQESFTSSLGSHHSRNTKTVGGDISSKVKSIGGYRDNGKLMDQEMRAWTLNRRSLFLDSEPNEQSQQSEGNVIDGDPVQTGSLSRQDIESKEFERYSPA